MTSRFSSCEDDLEIVSQLDVTSQSQRSVTPRMDAVARRPLYKGQIDEKTTKDDLSLFSRSGSLYIPIQEEVGTARGTSGRKANGDSNNGNSDANGQMGRASDSNGNSSGGENSQRANSDQRGGSGNAGNSSNNGNVVFMFGDFE